MTTEARLLQCPGCGASVPLKELAAVSACPYCGTLVGLPEGVQSELSRHHKAVTSGLQGLQAEQRAAAHNDATNRLREISSGVLVVAILLTTLILEAISGVIGRTWHVTALSWAVPVVALGWFQITTWRRRSADDAKTQLKLSAGSALCPQCGVAHEFEVVASSVECRYCGAALLPSSAIIVQGKRAIDERWIRARMDHWRIRRANWTVRKSASGTNGPRDHRIVRLDLTFAPLVLGIATALARLLIGATRTPGALKDSSYFGALIICVAMIVLAVAASWIDRQYMGPRWAAGLASLRSELGGAEQDPVGWLDSVWAGPAPRGVDGSGRYHEVIVLRLNGYPVMVYASTSAVIVLLAAWLPEFSDLHDGHPASVAWLACSNARAILSELTSSDLDVTVTAAGLVATVCRNSMSDFRSRPERLVALAPAIRRLADLAVAIPAQHIDTALFGARESGPQLASDASSREDNG